MRTHLPFEAGIAAKGLMAQQCSMPRSIATLALAAFLTCAAPGLASTRASADPARTLALPPTKIMVLGIGHLDGAPAGFQTAWLEPVLCRLRAYAPDVILTEAMPGEQIMMLDAYTAYHGDAGKYGRPTLAMAKAAQAEMKLTAGEALAQAEALAAKHPATPNERRHLAALFAAAAEPFSATVQ